MPAARALCGGKAGGVDQSQLGVGNCWLMMSRFINVAWLQLYQAAARQSGGHPVVALSLLVGLSVCQPWVR
jgi:hypothetical protein